MVSTDSDWVALPPAPASTPVAAPQTGDQGDWVALPPSHNTTTLDAIKSGGMGLLRGALEAPGVAGDLANLSALGIGKYILPHIGMSETGADWEDQGRKGLAGENGFDMGSASIAKLLDKAGISYHPEGEAAQHIYDVAHFAGSVPAMGGANILGAGLKEGIGAATKQATKDLITGVGSGVGMDAGRSLTNEETPTWIKLGLEGGGALLGGGATAAGLNRYTALADLRHDLRQMDLAGVTPRFPSDVGSKGLFGGLLDDALPQRWGARGISRDSANMTQDELSNYAQKVLDGGTMPKLHESYTVGDLDNQYPQAIGNDIKTAAEQSIERLKTETSDAYKKLDAAIPPNTEIIPTKSSQLVKTFQVSDKPSVQDALGNSAFDIFSKAMSEPTLTWQEMTALRTKVSALMENPGSLNGSDVGLLRQLYKTMTDDMQSGAASTTHGLEAFNKTMTIARENSEMIRGLTDNVVKAETPEVVPNWLLGQTKLGPTRLDRFMENIEPGQQADLGRRLLLMSATKDGQFDLDQLMKFMKSRDDFAGYSLTTQPEIAEGMGRVRSIYNATEKSRALGQAAPTHDLDPLALGLTGLGGMYGAAHMATGGGLAGAIPAVAATVGEPLLMGAAAKLAQRTGMVGRMPSGATMGNIGGALSSNLFPDVYHPEPAQQHADLPTGADVQHFLVNADRPTATAYISQRLGQQAAAQLPQDDQGYRAGLFALFSDPASRKALSG